LPRLARTICSPVPFRLDDVNQHCGRGDGSGDDGSDQLAGEIRLAGLAPIDFGLAGETVMLGFLPKLLLFFPGLKLHRLVIHVILQRLCFMNLPLA
jgi:hypothetical protein